MAALTNNTRLSLLQGYMNSTHFSEKFQLEVIPADPQERGRGCGKEARTNSKIIFQPFPIFSKFSVTI